MTRRRVTAQTVVGGIIVLLGALLLVETTGLYRVGPLVRWVPSLFVLAGLYALVSSGFRNLTGPLLVIVGAGAVQLVALDVVEWADVTQFWPVLLILFGLSIVSGQYRRPGRERDEAFPDAFAAFSGNQQRVVSRAFEGASATAIFGGVELDLRDAAVAERPARIDVTVLFGGAEIVVPREWNVELDVLPLLGAAEDERLRVETDHEETDLVVTGFVMFGGVSVKD